MIKIQSWYTCTYMKSEARKSFHINACKNNFLISLYCTNCVSGRAGRSSLVYSAQHFTILKLRNPSNVKWHVDQKRRSTDFEAAELRNVRPGAKSLGISEYVRYDWNIFFSSFFVKEYSCTYSYGWPNSQNKSLMITKNVTLKRQSADSEALNAEKCSVGWYDAKDWD